MDAWRDRLAGVKQHEELGKSQAGIFYDDERIISGRNFFFDNDGTGMDLRQIFRIRIDGKGNVLQTGFGQAFHVFNDGVTLADDRAAQQYC